MRFAIVLILLAGLAAAQTETRLSVTGDVTTPLTLKASDIEQMPHISGAIPEHDGSKISYEGVPLQEILKKAGVPFGKDLRGKALATYIVAKAHDGYAVVFSLAELDASFGNEVLLVADKHEGKPLTGNQGPLRLVCPNDKLGARSVRMLETLEVVRLLK